MSNFAERQAGRERERSRNSERRNALGKFFYNLALACFTMVVLGNTSTLFNSEIGEFNADRAVMVALGMIATAALAYIANNIMKK